MRRLIQSIVVLSMLFALSFGVQAADKKKESKEPDDLPGRDWNEDDEGGRDMRSDYPDAPTVEPPYPRTRFGLSIQAATYSHPEYVLDSQGNVESIQRTVNPVIFIPRGSVSLLENKLGLNFNLGLSVNQGDAPSAMTFSHFGFGASYVVYEMDPVIIQVGLDNRLGNDSLKDFFSMDYYYMRPYVNIGIRLWRFSIQPFIGLPKYFDTNTDNDFLACTPFANLTAIQQSNCVDKAHEDARFPNRIPNSLADDDYFGIDYGLPIALSIYKGFYASVEPSGTFWLSPQTLSYNYITPGVGYGSGKFNATMGVMFPLPPKHADQEDWQLVVGTGFNF